jgi:serine/threonine-protein kinase
MEKLPMENEGSAKVAVVNANDPVGSPAVTPKADPFGELPEEQRRLGDYRLVAEFARGGMGIVYLALRRSEIVLLKELRHEFLDNPGVVQMFEEEARLATLLSHPNIVQTVVDVGTIGSRRFIAMEYLEGQPLHQLVQRAVAHSKRMPMTVHLRILLQVLSALEGAHNATRGEPGLGLVHGDFGPHKVLVTYDGQVKLVDFGSCGIFGAMAEKPADSTAEKVRYMAPEQAAGEYVDGRADVFAVGVMLWEAIADRPPWDGQPDDAVRRRLKSGSVPRMREIWPDVDPLLAAIVDRSMSARPDQRYATPHEMRRDLERHIVACHIRLPTAESVGDFVSALFAEERDTRRAQVHALLQSVDTAGPPVPARPAPPPERLAPVQSPTKPPELGPAPIRAASDRESLFDSELLSKLRYSGKAPTDAPLFVSAPPPRRSIVRRAMLSVALGACLGAFAAFAVSATRFHAGDEQVTVTAPSVLIATAVRPSLPTVLLDDGPPESNSAVLAPRPSPAPRLQPKRTAEVERAIVSPAATSDCAPPYTIDPQTGKKQWRLDCL